MASNREVERRGFTGVGCVLGKERASVSKHKGLSRFIGLESLESPEGFGRCDGVKASKTSKVMRVSKSLKEEVILMYSENVKLQMVLKSMKIFGTG